MCFTFAKNNKQTKKPVNYCLQDAASAGIWSPQTCISAKCQGMDFSQFETRSSSSAPALKLT